MRRLARYMLNAMTVLSLVLLVGTMALWVRSYDFQDRQSWYRSGSEHWHLTSEYGTVTMERVVAASPVFDEATRWHSQCNLISPSDRISTKRRRGHSGVVTYPATRYAVGATLWWVDLPDWLLVTAYSVVPTIRFVLRLKRVAPRGLCPRCGYDLRATPDRCPECGTAKGAG